MKKILVDKSPCVEDIVVFNFQAGEDDSAVRSFNSVQIYFIEKEMGHCHHTHQNKFYNKDCVAAKEQMAEELKEKPHCKKTLKKYLDAKTTLENNAFKSSVHFKDLLSVHQNGSSKSPLWVDESSLEVKKLKSNIFEYEWNTAGMSAGDYIVIWTWQENGKDKSNHRYFDLNVGSKYPKIFDRDLDTQAKYRVLIERFLPRMFKYLIHDKDVTPQIINKILEPIGINFAKIEDYLLDLMEVYDVKTSNEYVLQLIANMFGLKLRSDDDYLWRRQIKNAISLYKKKGTEQGLIEALEQAAIKVNKITRLWQVMSECYWCECFKVKSDYEKTFVLTKNPLNNKDVEVEIRSGKNGEYIKVPEGVVDFTESLEEGKTIMYWTQGDIELFEGDFIRARYPYKDVDNKSLEDYIYELPLADERDEADQDYPIKNYNIHLIEEDDPLFDTIIKERHPFAEDVVFGKIRTIFGYSENVYNMDTYNGSLRDSTHPCHIDKDFLDTCNYGQSSKFNIELDVASLCDMRIQEAREIIEDFKPFHSMVGTMTINGLLKDYIISPVENIDLEQEDSPEEKITCQERISFKVINDDGTEEDGTLIGS